MISRWPFLPIIFFMRTHFIFSFIIFFLQSFLIIFYRSCFATDFLTFYHFSLPSSFSTFYSNLSFSNPAFIFLLLFSLFLIWAILHFILPAHRIDWIGITFDRSDSLVKIKPGEPQEPIRARRIQKGPSRQPGRRFVKSKGILSKEKKPIKKRNATTARGEVK